MRILIIHNRYQQRGGEDTTFEQETELLQQTEDVQTLIFQNRSGWKGALQFLFSIWNTGSAGRIKGEIKNFHPDVIHVHNWHYAIGPIVVRVAYKSKIPIVLTVQNYRLICPSATLLDGDKLFLDSIRVSFPWKAIRKKLYRNSYLQSFWLAFVIWLHKKIGTWNMADRYILQTELARSVFESSMVGITKSKFVVKPNFIVDPGLPPVVREDYFLYVGRLSEEKGISTLIEAFRDKPFELFIAGDGPLKSMVLDACKKNPGIHYLGLLDKKSVTERMQQCSALVFPSVWYEGMPLTLIEAFAAGTPVIASDLGAMASMIRNGFNGMHFKAGSVKELSVKLEDWTTLNEMGKSHISMNARLSYESLYSPEKNREQLLAIYTEVLQPALAGKAFSGHTVMK